MPVCEQAKCNVVTCITCGNRVWTSRKTQDFRVPFPAAEQVPSLSRGPLKYQLETIQGKPCYVPCNADIVFSG